MAVDEDLVGREYAAPRPYPVTEEKIREFVSSTGAEYDGGDAPSTFPMVLAFEALQVFLDAERIDLSRIVHGDQRFFYERPVRPGDVLTCTLGVTGLRRMGGADVIATASEVRDADDRLVCTAKATFVHSGATS